MKNLLTTIIAILVVTFAAQPSYAGFILTKSTTVEHVSPPADTKQTVHSKREELRALIKSKITSVFSADGEKQVKSKRSAWQNIVAFSCSALGFLSIFMGFAGVISAAGWSGLAAAAVLFGLLCGVGGIVFGIVGLKHRRKWRFKGFALAALILGCIDLFFLLVVVLLAAAMAV